ncbi:MAG: SRPBCC family protein [Thermodesulfovibrionales bacterium]|nr:SRPBCC family protein [Thermodesulfovibrionales bacterium]
MHKIQESIEIKASAKKVFALLKDIDRRLRLNPFLKIIWIQKLTEGEPKLGSRFWIVTSCNNRRRDCIVEWIEYEENKKIVSYESITQTKLTLTLSETSTGTILTHKEEFEIPFDIVFRDELGEEEIPLWRKILYFAKPFPNIEYTNKVEVIKERLRANLKILLTIIKKEVEKDL